MAVTTVKAYKDDMVHSSSRCGTRYTAAADSTLKATVVEQYLHC